MPPTLPLICGCAPSSTFLPLPSFLLPPSLQRLAPGFLSSYFRRTLTGSLSLCEAEVSPGSRISPTQTSTHTRPQEPRARPGTHARTHTHSRSPVRLPPGESRRAFPPWLHPRASRARSALADSAARKSDRSPEAPRWFFKHSSAFSPSFWSRRFRSGGARGARRLFSQPAPVGLPSSIWLIKVC